jgi:nicotinamide mononucleotide transporter
MELSLVFDQFVTGIQQTSLLEFVAVCAGIASVWFSRKENILVYPIGLINTTIYIYLSLKGQLYGEASVNLYYTIVSIYGWVWWSKINQNTQEAQLKITLSNSRERIQQWMFFASFYVLIFVALTWLKESFAPEAIPWADAFASATAYTGMWLMARKKVASWYWWIATNIASIPLYFVKGYVFTSVQFLVLLILAIAGLISWHKKAKHERH